MAEKTSVTLCIFRGGYTVISGYGKHDIWFRGVLYILTQQRVNVTNFLTPHFIILNDNNGAGFISKVDAVNACQKHSDI